MSNYKRIGLIAGLFISLASFGQEMPPAQVKVHQVTVEAVAPMITLQGDVISLKRIEVMNEVAGELTFVALPGVALSKGEVIAQLDPELQQLELKRAQAKVKKLQADLEFQTQERTRLERLAQSESASRASLQKAIANQRMVAQDIISAEADQRAAERALEKTTIKAPFDGTFITQMVTANQYIPVGTNIGALVSTTEKEVMVAAPVKLISVLETGQSITVSGVHGDSQLPIRAVSSISDPVSRLINIYLDAAQSPLIVGNSVTVKLPAKPAINSPVIPRDAIVIRADGELVYKVNSDNTVSAVAAKITHAMGPWVVLESGVAAGDKVVVRGAERLMPGQSVTIIE